MCKRVQSYEQKSKHLSLRRGFMVIRGEEQEKMNIVMLIRDGMCVVSCRGMKRVGAHALRKVHVRLPPCASGRTGWSWGPA